MTYDEQNIFARILKGEISCKTIYEDEYALAFHDIHPQAPIHTLVIPKMKYQNVYDFYENASSEDLKGFSKALVKVIDLLNLREYGYRMITNHGTYGGQEVPHFHVHLLGGKPLGRMISSNI